MSDFDLTSAQPVTQGFDLASAQPVGAAPQQQPPQQSPGFLQQLRDLDQKYLGGYGRQAVLAARAVPDAANQLVNIVPNGLMATANLMLPNKYKQQLPSDWVSGYMDKVLPHPETPTEQATHAVESMLAGAKMPIPGGYGDVSFNPAAAPGGMNRGDTAKALAKIQARLEKDNRPWSAATQDVKAANEEGIPMRLTDVGPNIRATGEVLANKPGGAATTIQADRLGTLADTKTRVPQMTRDALGANSDAGLFGDALAQARSSNAKANYEAVRNDPQPVMDEKIWNLLEDPNIARVYQEAKQMNASVRSLDARMGKSTPPLADIYAPSPSIMPRPGAQGENLLPPPQGEPQWVRTGTAPDVRSLDFLQRALNTKIGQLYNRAQSGQGAQGGEGDLAAALKNAKNELVDRLKEISPSFKKASETYGDDSEVIDANQFGKGTGKDSFFNMSQGQAQKYVSGLSESAKNALRQGVAERLLTQYQMSGRNTNIASDILGGPEKQKLLRTLFDNDQSKFDTFVKGLQLESKIFRNNQQLLSGSQTFRRLEAAQDFENSTPEDIGKMATIASQLRHSWTGAAIHGIIRMMSGSMWNQGVASQAGRILSSPDPEQAAQALQTLENSLAKAPRYQRAGVAALKGTQAALAQKYGVDQGEQP
jgi:hypothetical protein